MILAALAFVLIGATISGWAFFRESEDMSATIVLEVAGLFLGPAILIIGAGMLVHIYMTG